MYHRHRGRKFGRNTAHRGALLLNLTKAVLEHEQITTTLPKAKDIRPIVEKLITRGKNPSLHNKRLLISALKGDIKLVDKILTDLSVRFSTRNGGYLRILKNGFRKGDAAPMAVIQFVEAA